MEGDSTSLFHQFLSSHTNDSYKEHLSVIRKWISKIGNEIGAIPERFRNERFDGGDAVGLPPPIEYTNEECTLRLYCMRVNSNAVILFSGAEKTARNAQDCVNVRPHFTLANALSKAINKAIVQTKDLKVDPSTGRLILSPDFKLEL